jgi:signal transduction histidine kinase
MGNYDSSLYYCKAATTSHNFNTFPDQQFTVYDLLRNIYRIEDNVDSAYKYMSLTLNLKDSIYSADKARAVQRTEMEQELKTRELEDERNKYENRLKVYALSSGLGVLLIVAFILYRNNRHKQEANILLLRQKEKIESTLLELKSTQAQLIQSEKMASLGELTAGIAHEIQNPLNFVNNFSEVNNELADELVQEAATGNLEAVKAIAKDIKDNGQKINDHGKRADAIVKGMLQHSRTTSAVKEPTDINRLADEYLRLACQGFRARDKSFNATCTTDFDSGIDKVDIVPQEIGRVILNLINNAFYAVNETSKQGVLGYEPTVIVGTRRLQDRIEISVKDNGNGVPKNIVDKIFQPFFTTRPTGQGTGLGLSLAYDIVKAHGGELRVETKEGEGATFTIGLPTLQS